MLARMQLQAIDGGERWKQSNGGGEYREALHSRTIAPEKLRLHTYGESHASAPNFIGPLCTETAL